MHLTSLRLTLNTMAPSSRSWVVLAQAAATEGQCDRDLLGSDPSSGGSGVMHPLPAGYCGAVTEVGLRTLQATGLALSAHGISMEWAGCVWAEIYTESCGCGLGLQVTGGISSVEQPTAQS